MTLALAGCANQMSDDDVDAVRDSACALQYPLSAKASIGIGERNPGKFWSIGPDVVKFSETLATTDGVGDVADAYADFADMFPEKVDSTAVFQEDVDTFNGHMEAISKACEGNSDFEEPEVLEYPTDIEDRAYLQGVDSVEDVK